MLGMDLHRWLTEVLELSLAEKPIYWLFNSNVNVRRMQLLKCWILYAQDG